MEKTFKDANLIKRLLDKKMPACQISKKYGIRKQKISKLTDEDIQYMIKLVENQTTSNIGSRKIIKLMNNREKFLKIGLKRPRPGHGLGRPGPLSQANIF